MTGAGTDSVEDVTRRIADRLRGLPDVAALSAGRFGTVTTPVVGGRIEGVALRPDSVEVGVVVRYGRPLPQLAADLRAEIAPLARGRRIDVSIEDVVPPPAGARP
ncbi:hypothetical protein GCM10027294_29500 [Marinactinospora endophytica]